MTAIKHDAITFTSPTEDDLNTEYPHILRFVKGRNGTVIALTENDLANLAMAVSRRMARTDLLRAKGLVLYLEAQIRQTEDES